MKNRYYHMSHYINICLALFLFIVGLNGPLYGQDSLFIKGRILGAGNEPVQDVSVSIEGVNVQPALTDAEGRFTLTSTSGDVWLIISPLRKYKSQRIFLNQRKELLVYLSEEDMRSGFDDVPLKNRTEKRRDFIASFHDAEPESVRWNNFITIDQLFQGTVPGMLTLRKSGMPGSGAVSYIRGISSMNTSNAPLIVVDGMPLEKPGLFMSNLEGNNYNPLTALEPSDISSVTILKDAAATAIYGTRGSNGVIYIETLEAKATQTIINVSYKTGLNLAPDVRIPLLNAEQYKVLANEILMSSPIKLEDFDEAYPGLYMTEGGEDYYRYTHNTNWQDLIFTNSVMNQTYLSIKGGSEIATYGLSVGYHDEDGIIKNTRYNRYNVGFVSDMNVFSWLKLNVKANLINNNSYLKESAMSPQTNPIMTSIFKPPILSPYRFDDEGQPLTALDDIDKLGTSNPLAVIENFMGENKNYRFLSSIRGQADLSEKLNFNTMLGINFNAMKEFVFMPNNGMERYYDGEAHNVSQATNNHLYAFYTDNYFSYKDQIRDVHTFNTSLGFRIHTNTLEADFGEALNLPENDYYTNLQSGQNDLKSIGGINSRWNWLSAYHRVFYKFKDKYLLNTGLSLDFSTRTGREAETALRIHDYPIGLFYSVGAGWRLSEEHFLDKLEVLDNLLLRVSYGISGNDDIGNYNALEYYRLSLYRETSGLIPGVIPNRSLKYEQVNHFNAGFDVSFRGDRTGISLNYYVKTTEDMFINEPLLSYLGYATRPANEGVVENKGLELSLFQRLIDLEEFTWDVSVAATSWSNSVEEMGEEELVTSFPGGQFITRAGDPVNSFYGYRFEGVFSTQEQADQAGLVNEKGMPFGAGDAIYQDMSGPEDTPDGVIDDFDKQVLGAPIPNYFGSLTNHFSYKRWSLNLMFQFVVGQKVFNYSRYLAERMVDLSNQNSNVLNRWQYEGDETNVPRALYNDPVGNTDFSSRWIEDGSFVRLTALTLRYTIPGDFLVFKNADFYITGTNLLTFDNYLGYDPEFSYSPDPMQQGIDYGLMPLARQFLVGVKFGL